MKIILTQDVKNLGHKDDVVVVKDGYGRNYLIPKGMAKLATDGAMKMLAEDIRQRGVGHIPPPGRRRKFVPHRFGVPAQ